MLSDGPEHSVGNNDGESESKGHIILYVIVVGFHHKHGSQIEYCFPPIAGSIQGEDLEKCFPVQWQEIPSLAIPDGAHNVDSDVVYFVLPSLEVRNRAVYGISCYRQIPVDDEFREKDETLTRSTVQKSVCVLSTVPLYGVLKSKLQLITQAYFNEKDFSKVEVLNQMYNNLCDLFNDDYLDVHTIYSGISLLPLLKTFKHRALVLFKLLLLEKKIIFNVFPVANLGDILIGLISLFPGLLDKGLSESASYSALNVNSKRNFTINSNVNNLSEKTRNNMPDKIGISQQTLSFSTQNTAIKDGHGQKSSSRNPSSFETDDYGFPLSIFTKGSIFHPYLNINSIDMLRSDSVRAFCVGVTNSIFLQRRELLDVIVTMNEKGDGQVDILSQELKRQLALTKQDLRFMDFLLKMIELNDATLWEGSDDWVRSQFYNYLVAMLAAASAAEKSLISARKLANNLDNKESANPTSMEVGELGGNYAQEFNAEFITTLHSKHNYRVWSCGTHPKFAEASPRHPFAGQSSVNDVLLRVNHAMNDSEQGRRVLSAFSSTGRLVAETKSRLRSSIASWWGRDNENNTNTADDQQSIDAAVEATEEIRLDVINEKK